LKLSTLAKGISVPHFGSCAHIDEIAQSGMRLNVSDKLWDDATDAASGDPDGVCRALIAEPAEPVGPPLAEVVAAVSATAFVRPAGRPGGFETARGD
jgi:hypothetical protein